MVMVEGNIKLGLNTGVFLMDRVTFFFVFCFYYLILPKVSSFENLFEGGNHGKLLRENIPYTYQE